MSTAYKQRHRAKNILDYDKYWAACFEPAPFLPMSRAEMDLLGWDSCDFILVCGNAYIDHPSFCSGVIGVPLKHKAFAWASSRSLTGRLPMPFVCWANPTSPLGLPRATCIQ